MSISAFVNCEYIVFTVSVVVDVVVDGGCGGGTTVCVLCSLFIVLNHLFFSFINPTLCNIM